MLHNKRNFIFILLAGIFITNAITAELIGGKLIQIYGFTLSLGILPWPIVFVITDLINEYFGQKGVRRLTFLTAGLICYAFILLFFGMKIPAVDFSPVKDEQFTVVFGQSMWIIVGSIIAFLLSQLVDVYVFWMFKKATGDKHIWLRATGSTMVSQLIDTFVVQFIAFVLPGKWPFSEFLVNASWGYAFKLLVALALIPMIYLGHYVIGKYLKKHTTVTI